MNDLWRIRVTNKPKQWLMLIFEEFQLYAKNVRGNVSQSILRMMSVGANHKIQCLGITPEPSLVDCAYIRLAQQRYHFKLGNEPNARRRSNRYYSKDWTRVARKLDVGFCIYANKEKLKIAKIPKFESDITPKLHCEPEPKKKTTIWQKIKNAISGSVYEETEPMDTEIEEDALIVEDLFGEDWQNEWYVKKLQNFGKIPTLREISPEFRC